MNRLLRERLFNLLMQISDENEWDDDGFHDQSVIKEAKSLLEELQPPQTLMEVFSDES